MSNFTSNVVTEQIPDFLPSGNLPPGIHSTSWDVFKKRFGVNHRRNIQLEGLERALEEFVKAGCTKLFVDGSFVTSKKNPGDFDALYELEEVNDEVVDTILLDASLTGRKKQKMYYEGEFFPAYIKAHPNGTRYLDFFQKDKKTNQPKGIVKINLR